MHAIKQMYNLTEIWTSPPTVVLARNRRTTLIEIFICLHVPKFDLAQTMPRPAAAKAIYWQHNTVPDETGYLPRGQRLSFVIDGAIQSKF